MVAKKQHRAAKRKLSTRPRKWHASPLKGSFMVISILGFLITTYLIYNPDNPSYGVTFMIIFAAMFVASLISMTQAPIAEN